MLFVFKVSIPQHMEVQGLGTQARLSAEADWGLNPRLCSDLSCCSQILLLVCLFVVFLPFLGPFLRHMEVPRLGVESEV